MLIRITEHFQDSQYIAEMGEVHEAVKTRDHFRVMIQSRHAKNPRKYGASIPHRYAVEHSDKTAERLRQLDTQADEIRKAMGYSAPGVTLTKWSIYDGEAFVAIADGYGCATVQHIEELGWDDHLLHKKSRPLSEARALRLCELLAERAGCDIH